MKKIRIAIDGPSGSGKSTIAKATAKKLGYVYVDTGALYRTVGLWCKRCGVDPSDEGAVEKILPDAEIALQYENGTQIVTLGGESVGDAIRTPEMSKYASAVSKHPAVRAFLLGIQRKMAQAGGVIMDGRDIGTVVLPRADVKIFLTASPEERARRRFEELQAKGDKSSYAQVLDEMKKRDKQDSERDIAPLRPARDAVKLDTSGNTIEQSVQEILEIVRRKLG